MSVVKVQGNPSGTGAFTIAAPATNTDRTLTLPDQTGTVLTNAGPFTANASAANGAVTVDASNNVGIGTSSPISNGSYSTLTVGNSTGGVLELAVSGSRYGRIYADTSVCSMGSFASIPVVFKTGDTERARITSNGTMLIGRSADVSATTRLGLDATASIAGFVSETGPTTSVTHGRFINGNGTVGSISTNGTATTYSTSSDYRLKEQVAPMIGALERVAALKPCTYKWKTDGSDGEGFIAHELAEVVPECVVGAKDAVNADGSPVYQGIDTSFLVATLTAAIQEQQVMIEDLKARVAALEAK